MLALNSKMAFPSADALLEVHDSAQLGLVCMLFAVFAAATMDDNRNTTSKLSVVPKASPLAVRFAASAGLLGVRSFIVPLMQQPSVASVSVTFPAEGSLDVPIWGQLGLISVLLVVFAAATCDDDQKGEQTSKPHVVPEVGSVALRLAAVAGLFGTCGAFQALLQMMLTMRASAAFPPTEALHDVPAFVQLGSISLLFAVFAVAIGDDDQDGKRTAEQSSKPHVVPEVRSLAVRFAAGSGLLCVRSALLFAMSMQAGVTAMPAFSANATLEVPEWVQLGLASMLLAIFAAAIADDEQTSEQPSKPHVVPEARSLALRLSAGICLLSVRSAVLSAMSMQAGAATAMPAFPTEATLEAPVWIQLGLVSVLLTVFAVAISEDKQNSEEVSKPHVVPEVGALALRFAALAGFLNARFAVAHMMSMMPSTSTASSIMEAFPSQATLEVPVAAQLCLASLLFAVFAAAIEDDSIEKSSKPHVVPEAKTVALRLAVATGLFSVGNVVSSALPTHLLSTATSPERLMQGGLLVVGTAALLSHSNAQATK